MTLRVGVISVKEYSLKFTQLSKYVPKLVTNLTTTMYKFVIVVSSLVEEESRTTMLYHDMDITRLMV